MKGMARENKEQVRYEKHNTTRTGKLHETERKNDKIKAKSNKHIHDKLNTMRERQSVMATKEGRNNEEERGTSYKNNIKPKTIEGRMRGKGRLNVNSKQREEQKII